MQLEVSQEDSKMDVYTIAVIVLAIVVVGAFGFFVLRPEKLIK
jgi:nitrate reductase NapE component